MRRRIVVAILGSVIVTLALFGLPLAWVIGQAYRDDLRLRLEGVALEAAPELTEVDANLAPAEAPPQRPFILVAYYDTSGRRVAGRGPRMGDAVVRTALAGRHGLAERSVAVPVSRGDRVIGVVRAEEEAGRLASRLRRAWLLMTGLALVIVAAVTALAVAVVRRLTAPVLALADAARRLEAGDFAVAPLPSGIGELDTAGLALAAASTRLEGVLARERTLTADITHQLRTPLTALRLELEAGAERSGGPDVAAALAEVDRLEETIAAILALARDDATGREAIEIAAVFEAAASGWSRAALAAGRPLVVSVAPPGQRARISEQALRQILDVLIDNALRHGRGAVLVRARLVGVSVQVDVEDEGPATLDRTVIFARRSPSPRGHGIGLALARSLAEAEGGRLDVGSGDGPTTFSLLLRGSEPAV